MTEIESTLPETSTSEPLVSVEVRDVDVIYRVYEDRFFSLRELFNGGFKSRAAIDVHAVKGVSFDVHVGEAIGIIGSNGSGKSTLLRSIGGLQDIKSGSIRVRGVTQLLGVGAALKPALSGRRNVLLGGLAMGLSVQEIEEQMDSIIEFSGLQEAIGRPMRTYSSGMRARLAFAIATIRVPDILLIDEALAVGDRRFREKSLGRINEIREQAGTVIMVTHNLNEIRSTCSRALWLDDGVLRLDGEPEQVIERYEAATGIV